MFSIITWPAFTGLTLILTSGYYVLILAIFYRKELMKLFRRRQLPLALTFLLSAIGSSIRSMAQTADGNNGINQANTMVRSYFEAGSSLMYAVAAIIALIGAIRVYLKWGHNNDAAKEAGLWFGGCVFLVLVTTVIRSFFGI